MFDLVEAFYRPGSVTEALRLFQTGSGGARFLAGGTDLVNQADRSIRSLIDLNNLGLSYIRKQDRYWRIGATTTLSDLASDPLLRELAGGILTKAAAASGPLQTRNMATIGGRIMSTSQFNEIATPLLALNAEVLLSHARKRLKVPLSELLAPGSTVLLQGSLLLEIAIPVPHVATHYGWSFQKLGRTESDVSLVNVAAGIEADLHGNCKWVRIALGAAGKIPWHATDAEQQMIGRRIDAGLLDEVGHEAMRNATFTAGVRGSAEYLREMCGVMTRRALAACVAQLELPL